MTPLLRLLAATVAAGALLASAGVEAAAGAAGTTMTSAQLTASTTALTDAQIATLTLTVHLTNPDGVQPFVAAGFPGLFDATCPCAQLQVVAADGKPVASQPGRSDVRYLELTRSSGTASDGDWSATTSIGAINNGHWELTSLFTGPPGWQPVDGNAFGASVDIQGSNWPVLTINPPTSTTGQNGLVLVTGGATYSDTGAPAVHVPLYFFDTAFADQDGLDGGYQAPVVTGDDGRWSVQSRAFGSVKVIMFDVTSMPGPSTQFFSKYAQGASWAQTPESTMWAHWTPTVTVRVAGSARDVIVSHLAAGVGVQLQRHTTSGWSAVAHSNADSRGTHLFVVRIAGSYRVRVASYIDHGERPFNYPDSMAAGTSPAVTVR